MLANARLRQVTDAHKRDINALTQRVVVLQSLYRSVASEQQKVMECVDGLLAEKPLSIRTVAGSPMGSGIGLMTLQNCD
jgi:hypothetical protein